MATPWSLVLASWALAALLMLGLWIWRLRLRNAGVVDVGWASSVVAVITEAQALRTRGDELGAFFGAVSFAAYDLTNHATATLRDWPAVVTIVDIAWGAFSCGVAAWVAATLAGVEKA